MGSGRGGDSTPHPLSLPPGCWHRSHRPDISRLSPILVPGAERSKCPSVGLKGEAEPGRPSSPHCGGGDGDGGCHPPRLRGCFSSLCAFLFDLQVEVSHPGSELNGGIVRQRGPVSISGPETRPGTFHSLSERATVPLPLGRCLRERAGAAERKGERGELRQLIGFQITFKPSISLT